MSRSHSARQLIGVPLLGLFLTLSFLGHDLLMAGDAHHAPAMPAHEVHASLPTSDEIASGQLLVSDLRLDGCDADRAVVLTTRQGIDLFDAINDAARRVELEPSHELLRVADDPTAPPGVRRALFQVFRI